MKKPKYKTHIGAITLIIVGIIFQLEIYFEEWNFFAYVVKNFWPIMLILLGISMIIKKNKV
ncbi:MAG TPA: hypothetical protein EYF74_01005 [Gammaproteobacteria bacterium]|jgi:hypothetical protein|nr:hypothetical protein [Flavobacteriaceae bacterium]HIK76512.1 hypothetical protein [Gammaproteobacteria bacterium]